MRPTDLPCVDGTVVTLKVVSWEGPIVEILFRRPIATADDVAALMCEARVFMAAHLAPAGETKAWFLTCYDGFSVAQEQAASLQRAVLDFNGQHSKGDTRYGGSLVGKALVISTAMKAQSAADLYATRDEALESLLERIRTGA